MRNVLRVLFLQPTVHLFSFLSEATSVLIRNEASVLTFTIWATTMSLQGNKWQGQLLSKWNVNFCQTPLLDLWQCWLCLIFACKQPLQVLHFSHISLRFSHSTQTIATLMKNVRSVPQSELWSVRNSEPWYKEHELSVQRKTTPKLLLKKSSNVLRKWSHLGSLSQRPKKKRKDQIWGFLLLFLWTSSCIRSVHKDFATSFSCPTNGTFVPLILRWNLKVTLLDKENKK